MITIFTDGAARGNPGPGGWGAIVALDDTVTELGGRGDYTTNNRMELLAVISAMESIPRETEMTIYTDSAYVLNGSTRWVVGWQKNNWKTSQKEDVLNRDLWERIVSATTHKIINWKLLRGHAGIAPNERCDVIATSFADKKPIVLYNGSRERYGVSLVIKDAVSVGYAERKERSKKVYSYVSSLGGVIKVHKTWEECRARVLNISGARFRKTFSPADEDDTIKEFSK